MDYPSAAMEARGAEAGRLGAARAEAGAGRAGGARPPGEAGPRDGLASVPARPARRLAERLRRRPLTGAALRAMAGAVTAPLVGAGVRAAAAALLELDRLRSAPVAGVPPWTGAEAHGPGRAGLARDSCPARSGTTGGGGTGDGLAGEGRVAALRRAYASGAVTPSDVAAAFLATDPVGGGVDAFVAVDPHAVRYAALESTRRWQAGEPAGPLDGILVGIKDLYGVTGYVTRAGTRVLGRRPDSESELVRRVRAAGAVIAGKTRTTELGLSPLGPNPAGGTPCNPHDTGRLTGGSSSGSAAAVAAGLAPLAVGSDGGGSLRIPPACCGVLGFKPTFGAVPSGDGAPVGWWSLNCAGPIAGTAEDLALLFGVLAGRPVAALDGRPRGRFGALAVGVDWDWWGEPDREVDLRCRAVASALGATAVHLEHLALARAAEYVTAVSEVATAVADFPPGSWDRLSADVRMTLGQARSISGADHLRAQQVRTLLARAFTAAFAQVDVIVSPMLATAVPVVPSGAAASGIVHPDLLVAMTAYAFPANLVGLPAASVCVGLDADGLPIGLQVLGRPGEDDLVLAVAAHLERLGLAGSPRPPQFHDALAGVAVPSAAFTAP